MSTLQSKYEDNVFVIYFTDMKIIDDPRIGEIAEDLEKCLTNIETDKILLSFRGVAFMGSAMIGKIIDFKRKCDNAGIDLRFCNICDNIMDAVTILQLHKRWKIFPTETEGIESFRKKGLFG